MMSGSPDLSLLLTEHGPGDGVHYGHHQGHCGGVRDPHGEEHGAGHEAQHDQLPTRPDKGDDVEAEPPVEPAVLHCDGHDETRHEHHVGAVEIVEGDLGRTGSSGEGQQD